MPDDAERSRSTGVTKAMRELKNGGMGEASAAKTKRWEEILAAAAEVFFEKGYDGTTIQDIADRVGMLKGSLYHYIKSKDDLLYGIIHDVHTAGLRELDVLESVEGTAEAKLHEFVRRYTIFTIERRVRASVFDRDFRALSDDRRQELIEERDRYDRSLRALIEAGIEDGCFPRETDVGVVANVIFQMINSIYHWYSPEGPRTAEEIADTIAAFAVGGVMQPHQNDRA